MRHYVLDGKYPRAVPLLEWAEWFEQARDERVVRRTELADGVRVSTVFLGLDHNWGPGPPHIFETMIFGGPLDQDVCERCSTWEQAERQHEQAVRQARSAGTKLAPIATEGTKDDKGL